MMSGRTMAAAWIGTLVLWAGAAGLARAGGVDDDLRRAAGLHRRGETAQAVAIWRTWAASGDVDAAYNLAVVHYHGDGVARDFGEAMKWYRFAAERGDRMAQYQVGLMFQRGDGVAVDETEAHRWFVMHRAAHAHHDHDPQMRAWRAQAADLLWRQEMRASLAASARDGAVVVAELRRRAGPAAPEAGPVLAAVRGAVPANRP